MKKGPEISPLDELPRRGIVRPCQGPWSVTPTPRSTLGARGRSTRAPEPASRAPDQPTCSTLPCAHSRRGTMPNRKVSFAEIAMHFDKAIVDVASEAPPARATPSSGRGDWIGSHVDHCADMLPPSRAHSRSIRRMHDRFEEDLPREWNPEVAAASAAEHKQDDEFDRVIAPDLQYAPTPVPRAARDAPQRKDGRLHERSRGVPRRTAGRGQGGQSDRRTVLLGGVDAPRPPRGADAPRPPSRVRLHRR